VLRRAQAPKRGVFDALLAAVFERARELELIEERPEGTIDATGMDARHVSGHYARTCSEEGTSQALWPKLTVVGHIGSHLIAAAEVGVGPSSDSPALPPAVRQAARHVRLTWIYADAGYDAEKNHVACEEQGIKALIKLNKRWFGRKWPKSRLRRRMRKKYSMRRYGRRSHAESIFSSMKRTLGSVLRARTSAAQARELLWRVLAFDLMILRRSLDYFSTLLVRLETEKFLNQRCEGDPGSRLRSVLVMARACETMERKSAC
jgi:hypothetical protein